MTKDLPENAYVYFVHSFRAETPDENISCYTVYNEKIPALVHKGFVYGAQFHPEKSGTVGLGLLEEFCSLEADLRETKRLLISNELAMELTETEHPQGVFAICQMPAEQKKMQHALIIENQFCQEIKMKFLQTQNVLF